MQTMRDEVAHFQAKEREDETHTRQPIHETQEAARRRVEQMNAERRAVAADRDQIRYTEEYPFSDQLTF